MLFLPGCTRRKRYACPTGSESIAVKRPSCHFTCSYASFAWSIAGLSDLKISFLSSMTKSPDARGLLTRTARPGRSVCQRRCARRRCKRGFPKGPNALATLLSWLNLPIRSATPWESSPGCTVARYEARQHVSSRGGQRRKPDVHQDRYTHQRTMARQRLYDHASPRGGEPAGGRGPCSGS